MQKIILVALGVAMNVNAAIVSYDSQKRITVDGAPFFVHGLYTKFDNTAADWQRHADAGLNTVLCYGGLKIDEAEAYGLKGIVPANDYYETTYPYGTIADYVTSQINGGKSHGNYLGVYIGDEIGTMYDGVHWDDQISRNNTARAFDVNHLTWAVMCGPPGWGTNASIKTASDILMYDDYPIGSGFEIQTVYDWGMEWQQANSSDRPLVAVIQGCAVGGSGGYREVTEDELRAMAYCALACRVNGLMYYQYYDFYRDADWIIHNDTWSTFQQRWSRFSTVANEINLLIPILLNGQEVIPPTDKPFIHRALSYGNVLYLLVANGTSSATLSGDVTIPITNWSVSDAAVLYGNATISKNGSALHVSIAPNTGAVITVAGNAGQANGIVATPVITPGSTTYQIPGTVVKVSMRCQSGATIRYTTDGNNPTRLSAAYNDTIALPLTHDTTILKARAYVGDTGDSSLVAQADYVLLPLHELSVPVGNFVIDGNNSDWSSVASVQIAESSGRSGAEENVLNVKCAWNSQYLFVLYNSTDTKLNAAATDATQSVWNDDNLELWIDPRNDHAASGNHHVFINLRNVKLVYNATFNSSAISGAVSMSGTLDNDGDTDNGFIIETAIPWNSLGISPVAGDTIGMDFCATDNDNDDQYHAFDWAQLSQFNQPAKWGSVILSESPVTAFTAPVNRVAVDVQIRAGSRGRMLVVGDVEPRSVKLFNAKGEMVWVCGNNTGKAIESPALARGVYLARISGKRIQSTRTVVVR